MNNKILDKSNSAELCIGLCSKKYEVIKINKKTKAKLFKDFELGDIIQFEIKNIAVSYAQIVHVTNITKGDSIHLSAGDLSLRLCCFVFKVKSD